MKKLSVVTNDLFLAHQNPPGHPECPERLAGILGSLETSCLMEKTIPIDTRPATEEEITLAHSKPYFEMVRNTSGVEFSQLDEDTSACGVSFDAALAGSGGLICSVNSILSGEIDTAFVLARPPGHHAEHDRAMGFCLFNHVCIAAAHLLANCGLKRVLIIDWDVHHGNGTQHIFYDSCEVLYFSVHQFPFYPGTGSLKELGYRDGLGYTVNVPCPSMLGDEDYLRIFTEILGPVAEQYSPEFILVSAGFDAYHVDPLGGMLVTREGFSRLTRFVMRLAEKHCRGNIAFLLEGGYNTAEMGPIMLSVIEEILDLKSSDTGFDPKRTTCEHTVTETRRIYSKYWNF